MNTVVDTAQENFEYGSDTHAGRKPLASSFSQMFGTPNLPLLPSFDRFLNLSSWPSLNQSLSVDPKSKESGNESKSKKRKLNENEGDSEPSQQGPMLHFQNSFSALLPEKAFGSFGSSFLNFGSSLLGIGGTDSNRKEANNIRNGDNKSNIKYERESEGQMKDLDDLLNDTTLASSNIPNTSQAAEASSYFHTSNLTLVQDSQNGVSNYTSNSMSAGPSILGWLGEPMQALSRQASMQGDPSQPPPLFCPNSMLNNYALLEGQDVKMYTSAIYGVDVGQTDAARGTKRPFTPEVNEDENEASTGQWSKEEECVLLHLVKGMVGCELKIIAKAARACNIHRQPRAVDKKLKRLIGFKNWKTRDQESILARVRNVMQDKRFYKLPDERLRLVSQAIEKYSRMQF